MTTNLPDVVRPTPRRIALSLEPDVFETSGSVRFGIAILVFGLACFGLWASLAPLSSAAIAPGVLVVESKRQQVEHLEGGIVRGIHVRDGDMVNAGDLLVEIESEASQSRLDQADRRFVSLLASRDRLEAEVTGRDAIAFDERLRNRSEDPTVSGDMMLQNNLFEQRRENLDGQLEVLKDQIDQTEAQISGLEARLRADQERIELVGSRLQGLEKLADRGFASTVVVSDVRAQQVNLEGSIGDHKARIEGARIRIGELTQQSQNTSNTFLQTAIEDLQKVETELDEFDASVSAAADVVDRMGVLAPISGRIVGLGVTSVGSVVEGGERLMEIVPQNDRLVIDALVKPEDIDSVFVGQPVDARLTAFNPRTTPPVPGKITNLSADRVVDERSGVAAYSATIELDADSLSLLEGKDLYPGMPAEVMILMQERTFLDYLLGPIIQIFERGMREAALGNSVGRYVMPSIGNSTDNSVGNIRFA